MRERKLADYKIANTEVQGVCVMCGPSVGQMKGYMVNGNLLCKSHAMQEDPVKANLSQKGIKDRDWFTNWFNRLMAP